MILTITLSLFFLVMLNFLLLKFSCNKTTSSKEINKKSIVLNAKATSELADQELVPTGS